MRKSSGLVFAAVFTLTVFGIIGTANALVSGAATDVPNGGGTISNGDNFQFDSDNSISSSGAAFDDLWEFTLVAPANALDITLTNVSASDLLNLSSVTLEIYVDTDGTDLVVNDGGAGPIATLGALNSPPGDNTNPFIQAVFNLAPGDYFFRLFGVAETCSTCRGGRYDVDVTALPLPPAIWLFLSALVGLVSFARVRRGGAPS